MDSLGDDVAPVSISEEDHIQSKENEFSFKCENCNRVEPQDLVTPKENDYSMSSFHAFAGIMEGGDVDRGLSSAQASAGQYASPHYMDNAGSMVEELMVRNDSTSNLAIVGTSNNRERMHARKNQWPNLYQLAGDSRGGNSRSDSMYRGEGREMQSSREDFNCSPTNEFLASNQSIGDEKAITERRSNPEVKGDTGSLFSHGTVRTKILSNSGFSQFFVKNTLKGKGTVCRSPHREKLKIVPKGHKVLKAAAFSTAAPSDSVNLSAQNAIPNSTYAPDGVAVSIDGGVNLREWLTARHVVNKTESLNIFRQILYLVDRFHFQGVALPDLQPSSFTLSHSNLVKYHGCALQKEMVDIGADRDIHCLGSSIVRKRSIEQQIVSSVGACTKKKKLIENANFNWKCAFKHEASNDNKIKIADTLNSRIESDEWNHISGFGIQRKSTDTMSSSKSLQHSISTRIQLEGKWYTSPEELIEGACTISSNIYSLGVLFFELLGHFDSEIVHNAAMMDLRHRILPPIFLSENPKETGFCLWLLYPNPSLRPTTREILQSEVISGQDISPEKLLPSIDQDDSESELLLHFLVSLKEKKENSALELVQAINCIEEDIKEIGKRNGSKGLQIQNFLNNESLTGTGTDAMFLHNASSGSEGISFPIPSSPNETRLVRNINQLESGYFSMRNKMLFSEIGNGRMDKDLLRHADNEAGQKPTDRVGAFFDGLCKYARYSRFKARGLLRTGDFNNSTNVICSLSFDRDEEYFAAAGVSKKIKIFDFNAIFNDSVDIHYPAVEMSNKSKLSCVCWNSYIKNYLASTDYDGLVKLWDASTGQEVFQYKEHEKRAWSVDFSQVHPTKLASGSDDCSVKLWSINEKNCLGTIKNVANVCCVQFSGHSTNLLAFGSADYRTYCYDLRNTRVPWCVLAGHGKAVSYVKFLDSETLVTASTDNTLKIWDLNKTSSSGVSTDACSLTLKGHTNEKNFVGLSISKGYIACGSETNEVYAYYRSLPMPMTSHKFGSVDPISGKETDDSNGQFVSSVCWRGKSDMVVAANSTGCIKVLEML